MRQPPAFASGMRGKEEPPEVTGKTSKRKIKRLEIEPASNGGHIITVHRHEPPHKGNAPPDFTEPEKHAHPDKASAHQHVGELMDDMSPSA